MKRHSTLREVSEKKKGRVDDGLKGGGGNRPGFLGIEESDTQGVYAQKRVISEGIILRNRHQGEMTENFGEVRSARCKKIGRGRIHSNFEDCRCSGREIRGKGKKWGEPKVAKGGSFNQGSAVGGFYGGLLAKLRASGNHHCTRKIRGKKS